MRIIAVDDERPALRILERAILEAVPDCSLRCFTKADEALAHAKTEKVHIAFLDIQMPGMNGLEFARSLKTIYDKTNILFVTGYDEHAIEAFSMGASGYIMKPPEPDDIALEISRLRNPVKTRNDQQVRVKCFGGFGVFVDEQPLLITWNKAKELLAYLVHKKGAGASSSEIAALLWEDKEYNHSTRTQTQRVISQLTKLLDASGIGYIIKRSRNSMAVDTEKFSCDYYEHLDDNNHFHAINAGEYMIEYSWGEFTAGYLYSMAIKNK